MKILFYDFEVFCKNWMVVIIDYATKEKIQVIDDKELLQSIYDENKDSIWVGYNSRMYDQYILKGILLGLNPFDISTDLIVNDINGYNAVKNHNSIPLNNFDISTGFHSLKQLEGFMGSKIKESDVDFNIKRKLTQEEIDEVMLYCTHDVEETINVFEARREEFDSQLSMIETFEMEMDMFTKTKAQLSSVVLGANNRREFNDEFNLIFPDTLVLSEKYRHVKEWYEDSSNLNYNKKLLTDIAGVPHVFAWGGIHGAVTNYIDDGLFVMSDIASMYPALMIEYDFISRNVENPLKYREIRDNRLIMKKNKDPRQLPMKIVLNSTYGAMKDKHNNLYDPRNANNVCVAGQLLLLDLIDKVEPYCTLVQSNTDGILVKVESEEMKQKYILACEEWCKRTRLDLEHDEYVKVVQKDVNNYIIVDAKGKYKSKGAYVKSLSKIDYDLPIINKSLINYFTKNIPIVDTINNCNELIEFQKIIKISRLYQYAIQGENIIKEKILRVFASTDVEDKPVFKVKTEGKLEKISYTPEQCFIYNENVNLTNVPNKLDKHYYIEMAEKRLQDFLSKDKKEAKLKSDIKGVNLEVKTLFESLLDETENFIDFLSLCKENKISKSVIEILIKLDACIKFFKSKKLLKIFEFYYTYAHKSSAKKDKLPFDENILRKYSTKETDKQFTGINYIQMLEDISLEMDDEDSSIHEKIEWNLKYYGEITLIDDSRSNREVLVTNLDTKYSPKFVGYCLKNGKTELLKVKRKPRRKQPNVTYYEDIPFKEGDILYLKKVEREMGKKKVNDEWIETGNYDFWATQYSVVK